MKARLKAEQSEILMAKRLEFGKVLLLAESLEFVSDESWGDKLEVLLEPKSGFVLGQKLDPMQQVVFVHLRYLFFLQPIVNPLGVQFSSHPMVLMVLNFFVVLQLVQWITPTLQWNEFVVVTNS